LAIRASHALLHTPSLRLPRRSSITAAAPTTAISWPARVSAPISLAISHLSLALKRRIGRLAYGVALARLLLTWERPAIRLEINGKTIACEAFYVAKGRFFAGGWSFAPTMRLTTPEFEVITLARADRLGYARFLWLLLRGLDAERQPGVERHRCTGFAAHSETPLPLQADGDIITHLPARLTISAPLRIH